MKWTQFLRTYCQDNGMSLKEAMKDEKCREAYYSQKDTLKGTGMKSGNKKYKMLELFKGTGSVGKVAKKMDFDVLSLDFDPYFTPDIETDILKWDYKKFHRETGYVPDMIWSSPPCNTYSVLAYPFKERDTKTAEPKSEKAKEGTRILYRTLDIIEYFQKLNPSLLFVIENPRGMMRLDKRIKRLLRETTLYCLYGDKRKKPTDFFTNFELGLNQEEKQCPGETERIPYIPLKERYKIPALLIRRILTNFKDQYKKN